ncbi:hypothetical protein PA598K_01707 [Paenibacillus sp. 598K]|uniref:GNAT family N-acetyltransferase n=1 Tax=Paenibacillus sp. 598K TaxID=1117987 RepID=UPI000FF98678|nr:GNAT family N-acetyltransferase [Paenibacillus sp. 598K]GBF73418.1 hypothetical protein PA598K_01707 [Paenibacillus sp. 598K]
MLKSMDLMTVQAEVLYIHDEAGRITVTNEPAGQAAPRLFWGHTEEGSVVRFREDMPDPVVDEVLQVIDQAGATEKLAGVIRILAKHSGINKIWMGPAFVFPQGIIDDSDAVLVTEENTSLLERGFPHLLSELHSRGPCYMMLADHMAVSVCYSARYNDRAAEAGVETLEGYRGRGYTTRAAASWAHVIRQSGRIPLYSTSWDNYASQSIARRLQLHRYGTDISID